MSCSPRRYWRGPSSSAWGTSCPSERFEALACHRGKRPPKGRDGGAGWGRHSSPSLVGSRRFRNGGNAAWLRRFLRRPESTWPLGVWTSSDGRSWKPLPGLSSLPDSHVLAVVGDGTRVVIAVVDQQGNLQLVVGGGTS